MRSEAIADSAEELSPLIDEPISDEEVERAAREENVSPRSVVRSLAGLAVRGLPGDRARRAAVAVRSGVYRREAAARCGRGRSSLSARTSADSESFSEWLLIHDSAPPVFVRELGSMPFAIAAGWSCVASLTTDVRDGKRIDTLTLTCAKGSVEVRTQGHAVEGESPLEYAPLQIIEGEDTIVTLAFASRARG